MLLTPSSCFPSDSSLSDLCGALAQLPSLVSSSPTFLFAFSASHTSLLTVSWVLKECSCLRTLILTVPAGICITGFCDPIGSWPNNHFFIKKKKILLARSSLITLVKFPIYPQLFIFIFRSLVLSLLFIISNIQHVSISFSVYCLTSIPH